MLSCLFIYGAYANEDACIAARTNIVDKIKCLKKVKIKSITRYSLQYQKIEMTFTQPMDHQDSGSQQFEQRIVLLHKNIDEPMLLQTSGYAIFGVRPAHIARVFGTNQLQIEHRYFENSIPQKPDWKLLNIKQSADDFHAITVAFQKIYKKPWVNTGASKGGMTSTYHRYFYPDDVVGTVADVAPLSFSTTDQRYNYFLENVGGEDYRTCRENWKELQLKLLENRDLLLLRIQGHFSQLGSSDVAFEHSVIEAPFYFWQYGNPARCAKIPVNGTIEEMFQFLQSVAAINDYTDKKLTRFISYFYQAGTELGGPDNVTYHLEHLRKHEFQISQYTPKGEELIYSNEMMKKIKKWAENEADEILYIYGEFDPWTAAEYPMSKVGKNTTKLYVPAGNHGANFTKLVGKAKLQAYSIIGKWLEKKPQSMTKSKVVHTPALEDIEFELRKELKL